MSIAKELLAALESGDIARARAALELGADPNGAPREALAPLHLAPEWPLAHQAIRLLLFFGANPARQDPDGLDALARACSRGHWIAAAELCAHPHWRLPSPGNLPRDRHGTPLACASAALGRIDALRRIGEVDACALQIPDTKGIDAFWHACETGHVRCANYLAQTCETYRRYPDGASILILAAKLGDPSTLSATIARGAKGAHRDELGMGALHHAAESGSLECARILLELGEDYGVIDALGRSPENIAHSLGHVQTLWLLRSWREQNELHRVAAYKDESDQSSKKGRL